MLPLILALASALNAAQAIQPRSATIALQPPILAVLGDDSVLPPRISVIGSDVPLPPRPTAGVEVDPPPPKPIPKPPSPQPKLAPGGDLKLSRAVALGR